MKFFRTKKINQNFLNWTNKLLFPLGVCLFSIFLFSISLKAQATKKFKEKTYLKGYVKDLRTAYLFNGFKNISLENRVHNRLQFEWYINNQFTFNIEVRNQFIYGDFVRDINQIYKAFFANLDTNVPQSYGEILGVNNNLVNLNFLVFNNKSSLLLSQVDRIWFKWQKEKWEIQLGRQRINWGNNFIWNPNDLFNTQSFLDFDYEERPGADALRITYYKNYASRIELAIAPQKTMKESTFAALYHFNKSNYDFQTIAAYYQNQIALGFGWAGNIKSFGFKGETTFFQPLNLASKANFVSAIGFDYSLQSGWFFQLEFLYNGYGNSSISFANSLVAANNLSPQNIWFGKSAIAVSTNYSFNPRLSYLGSIIVNSNDFKADNLSCFVVSGLQIALSEDFDFLVQTQLSFPSKIELLGSDNEISGNLDLPALISIFGLENNTIATSDKLIGTLSTRLRWSF